MLIHLHAFLKAFFKITTNVRRQNMTRKTTGVISRFDGSTVCCQLLLAHAQQGVTATEILLGANSSLKRPPTT
jgi:hypothetical protein